MHPMGKPTELLACQDSVFCGWAPLEGSSKYDRSRCHTYEKARQFQGKVPEPAIFDFEAVTALLPSK